MRYLATVLCVAAITYALDSVNGSTITELLVADDVRFAVEYDPSFVGTPWADFDYFGLGRWWGDGDEVAIDPDGDRFLIVHGSGDAMDYHSGVVWDDGARLLNLNQKRWVQGAETGERIDQIALARVTHGRLTRGHPVFLQYSTIVDGVELVSIDPTASPATETVVHTFSGDWDVSRFVLDANGFIYVLHSDDNSIGKLTWNSALNQYEESFLKPSPGAAYGLVIDRNGDLYTFSADQLPWNVADRSQKDIYKVDPDTGNATYFASVSGRTGVSAWSWDGAGSLWIALQDWKGRRYVTRLVAGGATSFSDAIAQAGSGENLVSLAGDGSGKVFLLTELGDRDSLDSPYDTLAVIEAGSGGGDGGGKGGDGGGKGGGKGKNK